MPVPTRKGGAVDEIQFKIDRRALRPNPLPSWNQDYSDFGEDSEPDTFRIGTAVVDTEGYSTAAQILEEPSARRGPVRLVARGGPSSSSALPLRPSRLIPQEPSSSRTKNHGSPLSLGERSSRRQKTVALLRQRASAR